MFEFTGSLKKGSTGPSVKLVQEMLCLYGVPVKIDSEFGPATDRAVRDYQQGESLPVSGVVTEQTFNKLMSPIFAATSGVKLAPGSTLANAVIQVADAHLDQHPREVGGENSGPWVRLYTNGLEGAQYPWCAAFVTYVVAQAQRLLGADAPKAPALPATLSCDALAAFGQAQKRFLAEGSDRRMLKPGSVFLIRGAPNDWVHTGIVVEVGKDYIRTIEGNTNDTGSREGYEVCERVRGLKKIDFVLLP